MLPINSYMHSYRHMYITNALMKLNGRGQTKTGATIHPSKRGAGSNDESDRCIQCALREGDIERDDLFANLEDRDKETDVLGGSLQTIETGSVLPIGLAVVSPSICS